jgi:hypothetical protein
MLPSLACAVVPAEEEREESKGESKSESLTGETKHRIVPQSSSTRHSHVGNRHVRPTAHSPSYRDGRAELRSRFVSLRC